VLLSFAQFEREVIGERVRDKIAASKHKGLWVGGPVLLGYRCIDKKLVVVPDLDVPIPGLGGTSCRRGGVPTLIFARR
jgi:DNA invertase Pin-like site-specific DNA recombinase